MRFHLFRLRYIGLLILVLSALLHAHIFPRDLVGIHVWRQTETQTVIRNFTREDFGLLRPRVLDQSYPGGIYRMELPLMQWVFAGVSKLIPVEDFAVSRVLTFLLGLCTVTGMYQLGKALFRREAPAVLGAWAFNWSPVFYYYTLNPLPDNAALCCTVWSLAMLITYIQVPSRRTLAVSAALLGLAVAVKLPYIVFGGAAAALWIASWSSPQKGKLRWKIPVAYVLALLPAALWYAWVIPQWQGNGVVAGVFGARETSAEILSILASHLISTLPELLLNYGSVLMFVAGLYFFIRQRRWTSPVFRFLASALLGVLFYYAFELPLIGIVHDYYLLPFLPFLFLTVGYGAEQLMKQRQNWLKVLATVALAILPLTAFLRIDNRWSTAEPGFHHGLLDHKTTLRAIIPADARVVTGPDDSRRIMLYYLDRKGWTYTGALDAGALQQWRRQGAKYFVTTERMDDQTAIIEQTTGRIFFDGTLSVYELR